LTNLTLSPELMVTLGGLSVPLASMVMVAPTGPGLPEPPGGVGDGDVLEPPHAYASDKPAEITTSAARFLDVVKICSLINCPKRLSRWF
jgi:hypothetical protein